VLEALKHHGPMTALELSRSLGSGTVSIRVHLRHLLAAGLVTHDREILAVGRPARRFRLTRAAEAHFPDQYALFAAELSRALAEEFGEPGLERILQRWEDQLFRHLDARLPAQVSARLRALAEHQSDYGFVASVSTGDHATELRERHCPIAEVARRFPTICDHEAALFQRLLGQSVQLHRCQARGDGLCVFRLPSPSAPPAGTTTVPQSTAQP